MTPWFSPYTPVERDADLPKFCPRCGRPMKKIVKVVGYDPKTGESISRSEAKCTQPWWNLMEHQMYCVSPRPSARPEP